MNAGANSGTRFELSAETKTLLGRDWKCAIVLADLQSSRIHAEIYHDPDGWWIRDNESSNGTFVNGQPIDNARLMHETEIKIGSSMFTFLLSDETPDEALSVEDRSASGQTVVLDRSMNDRETGISTMNILQNHNLKQDFSFLFHLSVKLLGVDDPDEVVRICMSRLYEQTGDIGYRFPLA